MKDALFSRAHALQEELVTHRRHLHRNAEVGMDLPKTIQYVKERLTEFGYQPEECGKSGIVALAGGKKPGPVFLLRADMDALPLAEEADVDYASVTENMHACGHDLHTAMLLGAAKLLKENEDEIEGTIKLMFQPAEETLEGAHDMIEAGLLENPNVDAGLMMHVMTGMPIPEGTFIVPNPGIGSAASDWFTISIQGKGGHGAMPSKSVDPINVAAHTHLNLQTIHSRELEPGDGAVLTIGMIKAGTTSNVIPDTAELHGTLRTFHPETRGFVKDRIVDISEMTASALRAKASVKFYNGCPSVMNDKSLVNEATRYLTELLNEKSVLPMEKIMPSDSGKKMSGSEDFAFVSERVPSLMLVLAAGDAGKGYTFPQHHPKAKFDDSVLHRGAAAYAYLALRWLQDNKSSNCPDV